MNVRTKFIRECSTNSHEHLTPYLKSLYAESLRAPSRFGSNSDSDSKVPTQKLHMCNKRFVDGLVLLVCWMVWKERNACVFQNHVWFNKKGSGDLEGSWGFQEYKRVGVVLSVIKLLGGCSGDNFHYFDSFLLKL